MSKDPFQLPGSDLLKKTGDPFSDRKSGTASSDSSLVQGKGGGRGSAAKKTQEDRQQSGLDPMESPLEPEPVEQKPKEPEAVLSDAKWTEPKTCFQEEADVSVRVTLPEGKEHLTRIEAELYAKMSSGPELISRGEGHAQPDGTATITLPVYKPKAHNGDPVDYFLVFKHKLAKLLKPESLLRKISETALKSSDHTLVPGISFPKNSSFIRPKNSAGLKGLESRFKEWDSKHPKGKIVIYGHANPDEMDPKILSERRAESAFAFITNDADTWEKLYKAEQWGLIALQQILLDLGHYHGIPDNQDGPKTEAGFKSLQKKSGLPESGKEDSSTRKAIFSAYMKGKHDIKLDASRFRKVAGNPWMGCSNINRAKEGEAAIPENRRVAFVLIKESKFFPVNFPCQEGSESACETQCKKPGKRSAPGIKCMFYDELVREEKQEAAKEDSSQAATLQEITEDFAVFAATIYGESAASSETAWRSVAHVIMNRIGKYEWSPYQSASSVIESGGFDAYTDKIQPYVNCYEYLRKNRNGSEKRIEHFVNIITPIYQGKEADLTGNCVLYYSPKLQSKMHIEKPHLYKERPPWNYDVVQEVKINGLLPTDDFKFFKYK